MKTVSFACAIGVVAATVSLLGLPAFAQTKTAAESAQLAGLEYRTVDRVWANVDAYFHEGDYNRVVALCRICTQSDPDFDEAYSCGAWILWSMGDKPAANTYLADGVARAKAKWKASYTLAEQLMVRREYKDALPHLQAATKSKNAPVIVWKQLAHAYDKTGNLPKSLATWEYTVKAFPDDAPAKTNRDRVKAKLKAG